jgi:hypothetical protein
MTTRPQDLFYVAFWRATGPTHEIMYLLARYPDQRLVLERATIDRATGKKNPSEWLPLPPETTEDDAIDGSDDAIRELADGPAWGPVKKTIVRGNLDAIFEALAKQELDPAAVLN